MPRSPGRAKQCPELRASKRLSGKRLQALRELTGLSQASFANSMRQESDLQSGVPLDTFTGWESGDSVVSGYYLGEWIRVLEETGKMAPGGLPWSFLVGAALRLPNKDGTKDEWLWERLKPENDEELKLRTLGLAIKKLFEGKDLEIKLRAVISVLSDAGNTRAIEVALSNIFPKSADAGEYFKPDGEVSENRLCS